MPIRTWPAIRRLLVDSPLRHVAGPAYSLLVELEIGVLQRARRRGPQLPASDPALLARLTAVVKTFERPKILRRLLASLRRYYPELGVIVVDDSRHPVPVEGVETVILPFGSGLSAGRQAGLERVTTPYFLLLDDDFVFYRRSDLPAALALMERHPEIDIMGGEVVYLPWFRTVDYSRERLYPTPAEPTLPPGSRIGPLAVYDKVANFFIGRTERVRLVNWDPHLKLLEHADFFTRARGILTSVHNPALRCLHAKTPFDREYVEHREDYLLALAILQKRYGRD